MPSTHKERDKIVTTAPARHTWETRSLNGLHASVIYQIPRISWVHWIPVTFRANSIVRLVFHLIIFNSLYRCCCPMAYVSFQSTFNNNSCHSCQNFLWVWWVFDLILFLYLQMLLLYSTLFVILSLCTCPVTSLRACGGELTNLLMEHCGEVKRMDLPPIKRMGSDSESFENNELEEHDGYPGVFQKGKSERYWSRALCFSEILNVVVITSNDRKVGRLIICSETLISIHEFHNNVWDNKVHSLIAKA